MNMFSGRELRNARTVLRGLAASGPWGSDPSPALEWCRRSSPGVFVLRVGPHEDVPAVIVKTGRTQSARTSLRVHADALASVNADPRLSGWRIAVPRLLAHGEAEGYEYVIESAIDGVNGALLVRPPDRLARLREAAADVMRELHGRTTRPAGEHAASEDAWLHETGGALWRSGARRRSAALQRVSERVVAGFADAPFPRCRIHGDFWSGNLLATADGSQAVGVVDWDRSMDGEVGLVDALQFLTYSRVRRAPRGLGDVVADELRTATWSEGERSLIRACDPDRRLEDPMLYEAAILRAWLWHVHGNLKQFPEYARSWLWVRRTVDPVLRAFEPPSRSNGRTV